MPRPVRRLGVIALASLLVAPLLTSAGVQGVPSVASAAESESFVLGGFESDLTPWRSTAAGGASAEASRVTANAFVGTAAAVLRVNASQGYASFGREVKPGLDAESLSFALRTTDMASVNLRLHDSSGQVHQQRVAVDPTGNWQRITISDFAGGDQNTHWGGAADGVWRGPLVSLSVVVDSFRLIRPPVGEVAIDDVRVTVPRSVVPTATVAAGNELRHIGTFDEEITPWRVTGANGASGTASRVTLDPLSGAGAAGIAVQAPNGYVSFSRGLNPAIKAEGVWFSLRSADMQHVNLRLYDGSGQVHQQRITLARAGAWQTFRITDLTGGDQNSHWGGANDGLWHGGLTGFSVVVDSYRLFARPAGRLFIDDVGVEVRASTRLIGGTTTGAIYPLGQSPTMRLRSTAASVAYSVTNAVGVRVASGRVKPSAATTIGLPSLPKGWYRMLAREESASGASMRTEYQDFAVLPSVAPDNRLGVATHWGQSWDTVTTTLVPKAGFSTARDEAYWSAQERTTGQIEFTDTVRQYDQLLSNQGTKRIAVLSYGNTLYGTGEFPNSDSYRQAFARYALASVRNFGVDRALYEIWNEWNLTNNDAASYAGLVCAVSRVVKAEFPKARLAGPALAVTPNWKDWMSQFIAAGGLDCIDVVTTHPYPTTGEDIAIHLGQLRALLDSSGGSSKPIVISETGWSTDGTLASELAQARNIVIAQALALAAGTQAVTLYDLQDEDEAGVPKFGILRDASSAYGPYSPKPAYVAQALFARAIAGRGTAAQSVVGAGQNVSFTGGALGSANVAWSTRPETWAFPATGAVTVTSLTGAEVIVQPDSRGFASVSVTATPVFVEGASGPPVLR